MAAHGTSATVKPARPRIVVMTVAGRYAGTGALHHPVGMTCAAGRRRPRSPARDGPGSGGPAWNVDQRVRFSRPCRLGLPPGGLELLGAGAVDVRDGLPDGVGERM